MRIKEFNRRELKYVIRANQIADLVEDLKPYTELDSYSTERGYPITSLYYDTSDYQCFRQKLDGTNYRRKLRVRIYGRSVEATKNCYIEIKEKTDRVTRKRRTGLPYFIAEEFCRTGDIPDEYVTDENQALIDEIRHITFSMQMQPSCVVAYDRLALNGHSDYNHDLRITFDTDMRGRTFDLTLTSLNEAHPYFMPPTLSILEVKVDATLPRWLIGILARHHLLSTPVSKYAFTMLYGSIVRNEQTILLPKVLSPLDDTKYERLLDTYESATGGSARFPVV